MDITIAREGDITEIMELLSECIRDMKKNDIHQWGDYYPTVDIITGDVQKKSMYVIKDQARLLGIIVFDEQQSEEYKQVKWLINSRHILVVHRLAVRPKWQHRGIARKLMDFAEQFAVKSDYNSIRLDAYSGNPRAVSFYEKRGYIKTGKVYFPKRERPFFCYEKVLSR
jgi:ribosomal protein S18 acetylase RimI-like enzyme